MFRNPRNFVQAYANPGRMIPNVNTGTNKKHVSLRSNQLINFIQYLPRDLTIRTNNSSARFNSFLLKNSSEIIMNFLATNPPNLDFFIQIDDEHNVIGKLERIFLGQKVNIDRSEYTTYDEIKTRLNMITLPNITGNKNFNNNNFNNAFGHYNPYRQKITFITIPGKGIAINDNLFLQGIDIPYFTIKTKSNNYTCNLFGIVSSTVMQQFFAENPNADSYTYDYDDNSKEFQYISDLFNFSTVSLSSRNVDCIKEIAEDLGINSILKTLDDFIDENEEISKLIDDQQTIVDSVEEIFVALFNIKNDTIEKVSKLIQESKWSRTEKDIYELSAFILHVSFQNIKFHENIIDLLIKLDEEKDKMKNKLDLLKPFISNSLISIFNEYINIPSNNNNDINRQQIAFYGPMPEVTTRNNKHLVYPLVYRMIKKGFMPKERIEPILKKCPLINLFFVSWFLPELIELNEDKSSINEMKKQVIVTKDQRKKNTKSNLGINPRYKSGNTASKGFHPTVGIKGSIAQFGQNNYQPQITRRNRPNWFDPNSNTIKYLADGYCPIVANIEEYKELRDKFENTNGIAKAIRDDDVDSFQAALSNNMDVLLNGKVDQNMFEPFISFGMRYINYAAAYGSIKCFKFMLLNNQELDSQTYEMAIFGGNDELIRIIDNNKDNIETNNQQQNIGRNIGFARRINQPDIDPLQRIIFKGLQIAIKNHKNDIFDWIIDHNNKLIEHPLFLNLMENTSALSGNVHSLIQIIDSGTGFSKNDDYNMYGSGGYKSRFSRGIEKAAKRGFYSFIKILNETYNKDKSQNINIDPVSIVSFNNIYILEYLYDYINSTEILNAFYYSIFTKRTLIINYYFDTIFHDNKLCLSQYSSVIALSNCFTDDTNDEFYDFMIEKINSYYKINVALLYDLIKKINKPTNPKQLKGQLMNIYQCEDLKQDPSQKRVNNINACIKLSKLIFKQNPKSNFTDISIIASTYNLNELIIFLINNKYLLNYINLAETIITKGKIDLQIFPLIVDQIDTENRNRILNSIDKLVLKKEEKLIDYLIKENASISSTLIQAVSANKLNLVNKILDAQSDPSFINKNSSDGTALAIAARNNYNHIASRLLSIPGIDPNIYNDDFWTPLVISVNSANIEIFNMLIKFYKDDITKQKWQLEKSLAIIINRKEDKEKAIDFINNNNNDNNEIINNNNKKKGGRKYLMKNLRNFSKPKQLEIFKRIIQLNCVDPNFNTTKNTLLTFSCHICDIDSVKTLLQNESIDANLINSKTGNTALITSIISKSIPIIKLLLDHPKVELNNKNFEGDTAFIIAIKTNQNEIAELIFNSEKFNPDEDEINCAFCLSDLELAKKIITNKLFNTNYINYHVNETFNDKSTLVKVLKLSDPSLFDSFIQHPSFNKEDKSVVINLFQKALLYYNSSEIMQKVLTLLDEFHIDINSPIFNGNSPLVEVSNKYVKHDVFEFILSCPNFDSKKSDLLRAFKLLYSKSSDLKAIEKFISMDILYNYDKEHDHSINLDDYLLSKIYDIMFTQSKTDLNSVLPFHTAIQKNLYILSACMINSGNYNVNSYIPKNNSNEPQKNRYININSNITYTHYAASLGRIEILKLILSSHAGNINIENQNGETPLFAACKNKQIECIKFLFQYDNLDYRHKNRNKQDIITYIEKLNPNLANSDKEVNTKEKYLERLLELVNAFVPVEEVKKVKKPQIPYTGTDYLKSSIMGSSKPSLFTNYQKSGGYNETKFVFGKKKSTNETSSSSSEVVMNAEKRPDESLAEKLTKATANLPSGDVAQSNKFTQKVKPTAPKSFGKNVSQSEFDQTTTYSFGKKTPVNKADQKSQKNGTFSFSKNSQAGESDQPSHSGATFSFGKKTPANKSDQHSQKNGTFSFGKKTLSGESNHPSHQNTTFSFGKKTPANKTIQHSQKNGTFSFGKNSQAGESDQPVTYSFGKKTPSGESNRPSHSGATYSFGKKSSTAKNPIQPNKQPDMTERSAPVKLSRPKFTIHNESFTEKPSPNFQANSHQVLSNSKASESGEDELSNDVIKISQTLLEMTESKARELALSLIDEERQQLPYMQQPPLPPPHFPSQSQLMFMQQQQQQQQQLYRMIQMTNELQAQNYWQMMNQAQVNQRSQSQTKKKKKRSKK